MLYKNEAKLYRLETGSSPFFIRKVEGPNCQVHYLYCGDNYWKAGDNIVPFDGVIDYDKVNDVFLTDDAWHIVMLKIFDEYTVIQTDENDEIGEAIMGAKTLYQVKGTEIYGTRVGMDSMGRMILEIKGEKDQIKPYAVADIEEVLPYSYAVAFHDGNGKIYHYLGHHGEVEVGDLLLDTSVGSYSMKLATVTAVDTKSRMANKKFSGRIIKSEKLAE